MNERASTLYQHVVRGLTEECSEIEALDKSFIGFVSDVRGIERGGITDSLREEWEGDWKYIMSLASRIHEHATNARKGLEVSALESDPLAEWSSVAAIEDEIEAALAKRKLAGARLVSTDRLRDWEAGWIALETCVAKLRAQAKSVQVKLELQNRFGKERAAEITTELVSKLPEDLRDAEGVEAFQKAVHEMQADQKLFHGAWDVVKALAMWVESPEERARKIRHVG